MFNYILSLALEDNQGSCQGKVCLDLADINNIIKHPPEGKIDLDDLRSEAERNDRQIIKISIHQERSDLMMLKWIKDQAIYGPVG